MSPESPDRLTNRSSLTGVPLAELDGTTFLLLAAPAVLAVRGDEIVYYCAGEAWDASPAARESAARAELASLRARVQELESRPAPALPLALPAAGARRARRAPAAGADAPATFACPDCEKTFDTAQGLGAHRFRAHGRRTLSSSPAPAQVHVEVSGGEQAPAEVPGPKAAAQP